MSFIRCKWVKIILSTKHKNSLITEAQTVAKRLYFYVSS